MDFKVCRRVSLDQDSIQPNAQNANAQYAAYHCTLLTMKIKPDNQTLESI